MRTATAIGFGLAMLAGSAHAQETKTSTAKVGTTKVGDAKALEGSYEIVSGEDGGKAVPAEHIRGSIVRITNESIVVVDKDEKEVYVTKYVLDKTATPHKITMTETGGPRGRKGEKAVGILEMDGDNLKLCYAYEGGIVPTEFKTRDGGKQLCFTMKRRDTK